MLSKDKIDLYLSELAGRILSKLGPEASIKIVVVGGAALAMNYTFRESTLDIDTYSRYEEVLNGLVQDVATQHGLDTDWLNHNVMVTSSFTSNIEEFAIPYKTYSGVLNVFTADALTMVCMKCVACRLDSHDLQDIAAILDAEPSITFYDIVERFSALYGDWSKMKADAQLYLTNRYNAMSPDLIDMMKDMLPPFVVATASPKELYELCSEVYAQYCA